MIGVIGGSGLYDLPGLADPVWRRVETPWGLPSDEILTGRLDGREMAFLPRHGRGHRLPPSALPFRANIAALKMLGATDLISLSACGSFREEMAPGDFVLVDQFIDRTFAREKSFFGPGLVAHVALAHPTCARLGGLVSEAATAAGIGLHQGGTYLAMEGPQFSTLAESRLYREVWGVHVIGMTNMPEAKLAREAELCYTPIAMVTDYDAWHEAHGPVDVAQVVKVLHANASRARSLVARLPALLPDERAPCRCGCDRALDFAIITPPEARDPAMADRLRPIAGRVLS